MPLRLERALLSVSSLDAFLPAMDDAMFWPVLNFCNLMNLLLRLVYLRLSVWLELNLSDRIVMETFAECRALGRFALRRGGDTIAIGVIDETL